MTRRILATAALAVLATGCADAIEALSPSVYYGFANSAQGGELCLLAERQDEPGAERCFVVPAEAVAGQQLQRGDLVKITYEAGEGGDQATAVEEINPDR